MFFTTRTFALAAGLYASFTNGQRALVSDSFSTCTDNSQLTATSFEVSITPDNNTIGYSIFGSTTYSGNATIDFVLAVDSRRVFMSTIDPCLSTGSPFFCPASAGQLALVAEQNVGSTGLNNVPDDVYTSSDPNAYFQYRLNDRSTNETVGCLQANLKNDASGNSTNSTDSTGSDNSTSNDGNSSSSSNETSGSNSTGGSGGNSGASTSHLSWTLLLSGMSVMVLAYAL
ncbi:hypothetical protein PRZ48_009747 [Zasmidium cellare]|uniref:ML-like domain-containing protein n=1 Tax=Zasmidium cellare TaxID=395010 RepID=A0ABR0ECJ5_ZASCE|nr:hypothetical protein PRZ48_009747 [Zasmidium cellare]